MVFGIYFSDHVVGERLAAIHNRHLEMWEITVEKLYQYAVKNTPQLLPACLIVMNDGRDSLVHEYNLDMRILLNRHKNHGAGVIVYRGELKHVAEQTGKDRVLVIPSSIHETILMPLGRDWPITSMENIITEINESNVQKEEWLSNHAYLYEKETNRLGWISDGGEIKEWIELDWFYPADNKKEGESFHERQ